MFIPSVLFVYMDCETNQVVWKQNLGIDFSICDVDRFTLLLGYTFWEKEIIVKQTVCYSYYTLEFYN